MKEGVTAIDVMLAIARRTFKTTDPDIVFLEWCKANGGNLREAISKLGVEVEEGPDFFRRIREAVIPALTGKTAPPTSKYSHGYERSG